MTRWVFGDQLDRHFLDDADEAVLLVESKAVFERRRFHRQKAQLVHSAIRHRAGSSTRTTANLRRGRRNSASPKPRDRTRRRSTNAGSGGSRTSMRWSSRRNGADPGGRDRHALSLPADTAAHPVHNRPARPQFGRDGCA
jgi:deoxyribodipyrimidine photo-lyase-related protein